jgi:hypothetical protein
MRVVLAHGPGGLFDLLPLLFVAAAIWIIMNVLRDGQKRATKSTHALPTTPWSRQVHTATRKRAEKPAGTPAERPGQVRRFAAPHLKVMDGEAADENRPPVPRRFEPPPPGRRKTG